MPEHLLGAGQSSLSSLGHWGFAQISAQTGMLPHSTDVQSWHSQLNGFPGVGTQPENPAMCYSTSQQWLGKQEATMAGSAVFSGPGS